CVNVSDVGPIADAGSVEVTIDTIRGRVRRAALKGEDVIDFPAAERLAEDSILRAGQLPSHRGHPDVAAIVVRWAVVEETEIVVGRRNRGVLQAGVGGEGLGEDVHIAGPGPAGGESDAADRSLGQCAANLELHGVVAGVDAGVADLDDAAI